MIFYINNWDLTIWLILILNLLALILLLFFWIFYRKWNAQRNLESKILNKKLDRRSAQINEFLTVFIHELNTPLSVIRGKMEMIIKENIGDFNQKQKKFLEPVLKNAERLSHTLNNLISTALIDQDQLIANKKDFSLNELINSIIKDFADDALKKKNQILNHSESVLPEVYADQDKIKNVLVNLLDNANKYTNQGTIIIQAKQKDNFVLVSVQDKGMGISKEDQKNIFKKFAQIKRFTVDNPQEQQGMGVGLYIAKNFVEINGGKIWFESEPNKGSKFIFSIPIAKKSKNRSENKKEK